MKTTKRLFETLEEMNLEDEKNGTRLVGVSSILISADKIKQGAKISMGADTQGLTELLNDEVIPILVLVNKKEFFKRKNR